MSRAISEMAGLRDALIRMGARYSISRAAPIRRVTQVVTLQCHLPLFDVRTQNNVDVADYIPSEIRNSVWSELAEAEKKRGIDALAWYVSFHNIDDEWGIYIPISSLHYIAERWLKGLRRTYDRKLELALEALIHHESMHYAVDRNVAGWEMIYGLPLHSSVPARLKFNGYIRVEEAIANAQKLREMAKWETRTCMQALGKWVLSSPPGYNEAFDFIEDGDFQFGLEETAKVYASLAFLQRNPNFSSFSFVRWETQFPIDGPIELESCPIHILDDQNGLGVRPTTVRLITSIPEVHETKKFLKMLRKLHPYTQKRWAQKKQMIAGGIPAYPEFEKLAGKMAGLYSLRIDDNYRAHFRHNKTDGSWEVVEIGPHTAMGHG